MINKFVRIEYYINLKTKNKNLKFEINGVNSPRFPCKPARISVKKIKIFIPKKKQKNIYNGLAMSELEHGMVYLNTTLDDDRNIPVDFFG